MFLTVEPFFWSRRISTERKCHHKLPEDFVNRPSPLVGLGVIVQCIQALRMLKIQTTTSSRMTLQS